MQIIHVVISFSNTNFYFRVDQQVRDSKLMGSWKFPLIVGT